MKIQRGPMKAILTATVAAVVLLSACGSDANTALEAAEDVPVVEEVEEVPVDEPVEAVASPEKAIADFTAAFGNNDADLAWSFVSDRCKGGISEAPADYRDFVAEWSGKYPGATATNIIAVVDGDRAAMTLDVYDGAGEFAEEYIDQPWVLSDGNWYQETC